MKPHKIIKAWAVINTLEGKFTNICGILNVRANAIFSKRNDAIEFKKEYVGNYKEVKVIPCEIHLKPSTKDGCCCAREYNLAVRSFRKR